MPHAKRYTTPTTIQETEGALVIGYWIATRQKEVARVCERHMAVLEALDQQEEQRIENEKIAASEAQRLEEHRQRTAHLYASTTAPLGTPEGAIPQQPVHISHPSGRRSGVVEEPFSLASEVIPSIVAQLSTDSKPNVPPPPEAEFKLGPGPLTNENVVTPHPPLPVINDPSQPYRTSAQPGTAEAALEVASLPPVEGAKVTYPCPSCGKIVTTGDVHAC